MAQILDRRSRVALATALSICTFVAARTAAAQDNREGIKVELGVTGGYHWFANDLELGVADDPTLPSPKSSVTFGIRAALVPIPMLAIEGEALGMPTKDNQQGNGLFLGALRIHLRYNLIVPGPVTPFVLAGVGSTSVLSTKGGCSRSNCREQSRRH